MEYDIIKYQFFSRACVARARSGGECLHQQQKKIRNQQLLQMLLILFLLAFLLATLITEVVRASRSYSTERVTLCSYTQCDSFSGYLFRNETALAAGNNNGPILYLESDGAAVTAGTEIAQVYTDTSDTDKRERAAELQERLLATRSALSAAEHAWQVDYVTNYAALMQDLSADDLQKAPDSLSPLTDALARRDATAADTVAALKAEIATLEAELEDLIRHEPPAASVRTVEDGYFYCQADGYEALCGINAVATLTPTALEALLQAPQSTDNTVGKLVAKGACYLVIPTTRQVCDTYRVGETYTVHFERSELAYPLLLESISVEEDKDGALLLFYAEQSLSELGALRRQSVRIEKQTLTGLRVPAAALTEHNMLYAEVDGVARAYTVTPILHEQGCVLLSQEETENALREGDRVLVSTRKMYDGKVLS